MCLQCGCGEPYDDKGEPSKNIVVDDIKRSVESDAAMGITTDQAIQNIAETWQKVESGNRQYKAKANSSELGD